MFWLDEGLPSSLRPKTRPRTTLSPSLIMKQGSPWLAIGTPGGDQQDQWPLIVLLRHHLHRYALQRAIDAPMFHAKHWPGSFYPRDYELGRVLMEDRYGKEAIDQMRDRGHKVSVMDPWSLGRVCAVGRRDGLYHAAATPRHMQSYAIAR
jgi:gamma-glutamyltranspeptidase/glutathione hydrolase